MMMTTETTESEEERRITTTTTMTMDRREVMKEVFRERKFSLVFVLTVLSLSFLTFLCEQEIFRSVCHATSQIDTYGDRVKLRTSDAGIFVGIKQKIQLPSTITTTTVTSQRQDDKINNNDNNDGGGGSNVIDGSEKNNDNSNINLDSISNLPPSPPPPSTKIPVKVDTSENEHGGPTEQEEAEEGHSSEKIYYVFKGIPYSQPPEGPLRWKEPQVVDIKSSAQDNTKYKSICSQWSRIEKRVVGSQNCLYLNIFTPNIPPPLRRAFLPNPYTVQDIFYQQRHLYPVLIYVHGGDFLWGSGNFYGAEKLLQKEDVVLVTFNYRLGIFGFLSNGGKEIPGNYGLLDQIHAIKWVHKYIQRFGGNPTRITIFGDVGYLLLSPLAVGLFQGAVWLSDSWNMFSPPGNKSLLKNPKQFFNQIATAANCPVDDSLMEQNDNDQDDNEGRVKNKKKFEMIECLKLTPVDDLIRIQQETIKFHSFPKRFVPVVDAGLRDFPVMMDSVDVLIQMGTLIKVPIIAGVNQLEGYTMLLDFMDKLGGGGGGGGGMDFLRDASKVKETLKTNLRFILEEPEGNVYDAIFEAVWKFYFGHPDDLGYSKGLAKKLLLLFGDLKSHAGFWTLSKKLTRNSKPPAFAYVFSHRVNEFGSYFRQHQAQKMAVNKSSKTKTHVDNNSNLFDFDIPPWQDLHYILNSVLDADNNSNGNSSTSGSSSGHNGHNSSRRGFSRVKSSSSMTSSSSGQQQLSSVNDNDDEDGQLVQVQHPDMDEIMVKIMTSFANYGTPKQAVEKFENWTRWHRIEPHNVRYYDLSLQPMSMKTSFRNAEALFWHETLPQVRQMAQELDQLAPFVSTTTLWILLAIALTIFLLLVSCIAYCCCLR